MRRPRISSCVYLAVVLYAFGSIGFGALPGVNISVRTAADALPGEIGALPTPAIITAAAAAPAAPAYRQVGIASWYGGRHQGRLTASGEIFDENRLTAAHRKLPLKTKARVTNLENGRSVEVKVNDRGPYVRGRVIDLSARAAQQLGMMQQGLALVRIEVVGEEAAKSAMD